jgi:hypothetical protein
MAVLTVQDAAVTGLAETLVAAGAGGDSFDNNGLCLLEVVNGGGAPITVTIDDPGSASPVGAMQFNPDVSVSVTNGQTRIIGPFPPFRFNDANGRVAISYSAVTSVTVRVIRLRP